jgi:hypothetical protein
MLGRDSNNQEQIQTGYVMSLSRNVILVSRGVFLIALCIIVYLAMTQHNFPVVGVLHGYLSHILAFYILALLIDFAFPAKPSLLAKVIILLGYGLCIEVFQGQFTERTFSMIDFLANMIGVILYLASIPVLKHLPWFQNRWKG